MGKSKSKTSLDFTLPKAPFIYINDPTSGSRIASKLADLIPRTIQVALSKTAPCHTPELSRKFPKLDDAVYIWTSNISGNDEAGKKATATRVREAAILHVRNSVTINIRIGESATATAWGAHHLDLSVEKGDSDTMSDSEVQSKAEAIYKWLFKVLTIKETLHLISDEEMRVLDSATAFPDAEYCTISNNRNISKDARVQFVALIIAKPTIVSGNSLVWQVADKTGVANFYFKWRGPSSQYTWDWVLSLEPGQRKCLPRMPYVQVKEKLHITLLKAPVRVPGAVIHGTGQAIKVVGHGLAKAGKAMSMGKRKKWVAQEDLAGYLKKHKELKVVPSVKKVVIPVFDEKGNRAWSDKDSTRSTLKDVAVTVNEKADLVAKEDAL